MDTYITASDNKRADLQVPVANNRIFFAGEGKGQKRPQATVNIVDDQGNPVIGAGVTGNFKGDVNSSEISVVTDINGNAEFNSTETKKGMLNFEFCVTDVSHLTLDYSDGDNAEDCDTN